MSPFADWFEHTYRIDNESNMRAIHRLSVETGLGWTTVYRAVRGVRVQRGSAVVLSQATSSRVAPESLMHPPARTEAAE